MGREQLILPIALHCVSYETDVEVTDSGTGICTWAVGGSEVSPLWILRDNVTEDPWYSLTL